MASRNQAADAQDLYDDRAKRYDDSWHTRFTTHIVQLLELKPGERMLDLACGTGLVSLKASIAVGPSGSVTAVDISTGMLAEAKAKLSRHPLDNITFHQHTITDLANLSPLRGQQFDVISCISALVLLPRPGEALKQWSTYLKPGGRLIIDVTHPHTLRSGTVVEHVGNIMGLPVPSYRLAFQTPEDLASIMEGAGLHDVSVKLISQLESRDGSDDLQAFICDFDKPRVDKVYGIDDADAVLDHLLGWRFGKDIANSGRVDEARQLFRQQWAKIAKNDGTVDEIDGVFVGIGWKP